VRRAARRHLRLCRARGDAGNRRDRRLSDDEYTTLGAALRAAGTLPFWPPAVAATRFLLLTGWHMGEALTLRRDALDLARRSAMLADTKTGRSVRPLSHASCELLGTLPRQGELVFPATRRIGPVSGFPRLLGRLLVMAGIEREGGDVTAHILRHSFASLRAILGFPNARSRRWSDTGGGP
jgi:integrase